MLHDSGSAAVATDQAQTPQQVSLVGKAGRAHAKLVQRCMLWQRAVTFCFFMKRFSYSNALRYFSQWLNHEYAMMLATPACTSLGVEAPGS